MILDRKSEAIYSHLRMFYLSVRELYVHIEHLVDRQLSSLSLTVPQWNLLEQLTNAHAPRAMAFLAERILIDDTTLTRVVESSIRMGTVERSSDPADRRKRLISITAKGRELHQRASKAIEVIEMRLFENFPQVHRNQTTKLISQISGALNGI